MGLASAAADPPTKGVLVVDDNSDLCSLLADFFGTLGASRTVTAVSLDDVKRQATDALGTALAFVDVNLGKDVPNGVDVCRWLNGNAYHGRIVVLTGHGADDPRVEQAARIADAAILSKPVTAEQLEALYRAA